MRRPHIVLLAVLYMVLRLTGVIPQIWIPAGYVLLLIAGYLLLGKERE